MAYETGTATSHTDLFDKLKLFLTTNVDLVADSQEWTVEWEAPIGAPNLTDIVLKGPGLAGGDAVLVGLSLAVSVPDDSYILFSRGMTGVTPESVAIAGHVNRSPLVGMYLDLNPMTYWFVANGRRFVVVMKISTVFQAMYGGLYLPYALPTIYPYPFFIGGTRGDVAFSPTNWRSVEFDHTHFVSPAAYAQVGNPTHETGAWTLDPAANWIRCWNNGTDLGNPKIGMGPENLFDGLLVGKLGGGGAYGYDTIRQRTAQCYGGAFMLSPITLVQKIPTDQTYGVLDGCFRVAGLNNAAENLVTIGGIDHLVVQNVFRTGVGDYWALALA